eukprot:318640-Hanusia_phi.AAC.1
MSDRPQAPGLSLSTRAHAERDITQARVILYMRAKALVHGCSHRGSKGGRAGGLYDPLLSMTCLFPAPRAR